MPSPIWVAVREHERSPFFSHRDGRHPTNQHNDWTPASTTSIREALRALDVAIEENA